MIAELLFRVSPRDALEVLPGAVPLAGDVHIEILAVDPDGTVRYAGTLHLKREIAAVLRGSLDRLAPQVWPDLKMLWAGLPLESVAPWAGLDPLLRLARKLKLLPT